MGKDIVINNGQDILYGIDVITIKDSDNEIYEYYPEGEEMQFTSLNITQNGTYIPNTRQGYNNVTVSVNNIINFTIDVLRNKQFTQMNVNELSRIGAYGLANQRINIGSFPNVGVIDERAFTECVELKTIFLPKCSRISDAAFYNCRNLSKIYLLSTIKCTLYNSYVFENTKITSETGFIYVPSNLVDNYKTDGNWNYFANRIFPEV